MFTSVPITQYIMSSFQKKSTKHAKRQEKNSVWRDKAGVRTWLRYGRDSGIIGPEILNNYD